VEDKGQKIKFQGQETCVYNYGSFWSFDGGGAGWGKNELLGKNISLRFMIGICITTHGNAQNGSHKKYQLLYANTVKTRLRIQHIETMASLLF